MRSSELIAEVEWQSSDVDVDFDAHMPRHRTRGPVCTGGPIKYPNGYYVPVDLSYSGENMNNIKTLATGIPIETTRGGKDGLVYVKGQKFQFVYKEPLPGALNEGQLGNCIRYLERIHQGLKDDFPALATADKTNVHISGNATDVIVPAGIAALANADMLVMPVSGAMNLAKGDIGTVKLMSHEVGHVFFADYYPFNKDWGNGIGEIFADFAANYLFPTDSHVYDCVDSIVADNFSVNLFDLESLSYNTNPMRCYNGIFLVFYLARFGKENFQEFLASKKLLNDVNKARGKSFWQILAEFNQISVRDLGAMWLADGMTMGFFRDDGIRWAAAKKQLVGRTANQMMLWKNVHNKFLTKREDGWYSCKKLEAFGFMIFDLMTLVGSGGDGVGPGPMTRSLKGKGGGGGGKGKGKKGKLQGTGGGGSVAAVDEEETEDESDGPITLCVQSVPPMTDDESTWVIVVAKSNSADAVIVNYSTSNKITIDNVERGMLIGVMHTKTGLMTGNNAAGSAINFVLKKN